jgi:hypothetical protein
MEAAVKFKRSKLDDDFMIFEAAKYTAVQVTLYSRTYPGKLGKGRYHAKRHAPPDQKTSASR